MKVQYVGQNPKKHDIITGTGLVWTPGQVHEVPDEKGKVLVKFPDVWSEYHEEVETKAGGRKAPPVLTRPA